MADDGYFLEIHYFSLKIMKFKREKYNCILLTIWIENHSKLGCCLLIKSPIPRNV
jgi:hypothetical protein